MCGRYVPPEEAEYERLFQINPRAWPGWFDRAFNVAPTHRVPILRQGELGDIEQTGARWGLIPHWWNKPSLPSLTFNARSEEAATKPMWRQPLKSQRCLMPARGWFEWNENEPTRNERGRKCNQPYFIFANSSAVLAIAGLWSEWITPEGQPVMSCALMTKEAAPSIASIHHRMPIVLHQDQFADWMNPATGTEAVADMIANCRTDFVGYRVSTKVNSAANDGPELLEPLPEVAKR